MVIYIHGFGSSGKGTKAKQFREYFKSIGEPFMAPSLSYILDLAIETLKELIESYDKNVQLIGSSLGGYYAIYLAQKYNLKAVLINPAIFPYKTLTRSLGEALGFYDESHFQWMQTHLDMLKIYDVKIPHINNFMVLLQKGDEVLDYKEAVDKFVGSNLIAEDGGTHSFENIHRYFKDIRVFLLN